MSAQKGRTAAEWATFVAACVILLGVIALIGVQLGEATPPAPVATVVDVRQVGEHFHVDVSVENTGTDTASNVQVSAELVIDGEIAIGDQTIDFLAGDEVEDLVFVFDDEPTEGELSVTVTGYGIP